MDGCQLWLGEVCFNLSSLSHPHTSLFRIFTFSRAYEVKSDIQYISQIKNVLTFLN